MTVEKRTSCLKVLAVVALVLFSMQFLAPLQSPVTSPVIVALSADEPVTYTSAKMNELLQNEAIVVRADDIIASLFLLPRVAGDVVFVGHGTPEEVRVGGIMVSWETFVENNLMKLTSQRTYVAACYSQKASEIVAEKYGGNKMVVGFKGLVDEAAYTISSMMAHFEGDSNKARTTISELIQVMVGKVLMPEKYNHWLLGWHYEQSVRGIWHIKYDSQPYSFINPVAYTHPDVYFSHPDQDLTWIGPETSCTLEGSNLQISHTPGSVIKTGNLVLSIEYGLIGLEIGALLGPLVSAAIGAIVGFLIGFFTTVFFYVFQEYLLDELGGGWDWLQNPYTGIFGIGFDFKLGKIMWLHYGYYFWIWTSVVYPLWYGGRDLGIDGI